MKHDFVAGRLRLWNDFYDELRAEKWARMVVDLGYRIITYCPFDGDKPPRAAAAAWTVEVT